MRYYKIKNKKGQYLYNQHYFAQTGSVLSTLSEATNAIKDLFDFYASFEDKSDLEGLQLIEYSPFKTAVLELDKFHHLEGDLNFISNRHPFCFHSDEKILSNLETMVEFLMDCFKDVGYSTDGNTSIAKEKGRFKFILQYKDYPEVELHLCFEERFCSIFYLMGNLTTIPSKGISEALNLFSVELSVFQWEENDFEIPRNFVIMISNQLDVLFSKNSTLRGKLEDL